MAEVGGGGRWRRSVAEVGSGGRRRRSEVGSGGRRSVAEVGNGGRRSAEFGDVKMVSMCSRNTKKRLAVAEVGGGR